MIGVAETCNSRSLTLSELPLTTSMTAAEVLGAKTLSPLKTAVMELLPS